MQIREKRSPHTNFKVCFASSFYICRKLYAMRKVNLLVIGFLMILSSSCMKMESLEIKQFKDFEIVEFKDNMLTLKAKLVVNNPNPVTMKVLDANFDLRINESVVGHLSQMDKITLLARSEKEYPVTAKFQMTNLKNGLMSLIQIVNRRDSKVSVSGSVVGKTFLYKKTFNFTDIKIYQ